MAQRFSAAGSPPDRSARALRHILVAAAVLAAAGGASCWLLRPRAPDPPRIETMGEMDPEVRALLGELRAGIDGDRRDGDRWARFALACEANGFIGVARDGYAVAARLAPREPRWAYRLAVVLNRLGEDEAALAALARAINLAPDYAPAWSRRGFWLLDRGDTAGAEAAFERASAVDREDPSARIGLARVLLTRREDARAAQLLADLLERQPGDRYALQLLGTAYRRLGRVEDAEFALAVGASGERAWNDPWSAELAEYRRGFAALLKVATADAMAGRFERALPVLERLRGQKPRDVALANHLADVLVASGRPQEAVSVLTSLINRGDANADTHLTLASAYGAAGDPVRAEGHVDRAIALGATGVRALEIKGTIAWRAGRGAEAVRLFEEGLTRDPRNVNMRAWTGFIRLEQNRPRDALAAFSDALRRQPMHAEALAGLSMAQAALGAHEEAARILARAQQVAPEHPRVKEARIRLAGR